MKITLKTKDGRDIIHHHDNLRGQTIFIPCDEQGDIKIDGAKIIKKNILIDWGKPLTEEELQELSK